GTHALGEAGKDRDLLIDLRLLDERPATSCSIQIPLFDEVEDGLADRGKTDAELIGVLPLAQQFLALAKLAVFDPAQQMRPKLRVDRDRRRPADDGDFLLHKIPLSHSKPRPSFFAPVMSITL